MSKLNQKQKIGLGLAALVGLCCCGSGIGNALGGNEPTASPKPSATVRVDQLADVPTASPDAPTPTDVAVAPTSTPPRKLSPKPSATSKSPTRPAPAKTTKPPTRKASPTPTKASVRQGVHPGSFCTPQGARGVTVTGKAMVCTTTAADDKKRWRAA
ncbi:hypothetical protein [Micromonospora sp. CA-248212]|uniref:hypothetical protein n=1 Tax=Micromonospora sp. CA-248212 TaxID=3239961 RepID=UPI003D9157F0